jgi:hypothetical protein
MFKISRIMTVVAMIVAMAATSFGADLTVDNFSFESPDQSGGTSGVAPTDWARVVGGGDYSGMEGRVGKAGPTDGVQIMFLDDRSTWGPNQSVLLTSNSIGTGAELKALGDLLEITFDARKGFLDGEKDGDAPTVTFDAYVSIGGVRDTSDDMTTDLGAASLLRTGAVILADTGLNMDTFTITVATAGMGDSDAIQINFGHTWGTAGTGTRTSVDNVRASVVSGATPGTLIFGQ